MSETATEPGVDASGEQLGDVPGAQSDTPLVRIPSIRLSRRSAVPIESLMADREADSVVVSGTVTQRSAILNGWLYEVSDDTGSLWVLTDGSEPEVGAIAKIEGIVRYEPVVVGEIDAGSIYLEEQSYQQENQ